MKLLITPKPERDESFIGYIVRLTESNGFDTPSWIFSLSGIDYMELQWKFTFVFSVSEGLEKLAKVTGNTLPDLLPLLYLPANSMDGDDVEEEYNFYGAFLNRSIIRPHCPKVCPKCLINSAHSLRVWDCSLVTACPIHECILIDSCPKCKRRIRCVRNRLSVCMCGCDWRETDPKLVPEHELVVSRSVYQLCGILSPQNVSSEGRRNPLHSLGLKDFALVVTFIAGLYGKMAWATGRPAQSIKLRNADLHKLFTKAYAVFDNWPRNFHQFLQQQSTGRRRLNPDGGKLDTALKREFGPFYERLYRDLDGCQFDFMREAFAHFLTGRLKSQSPQSPKISPDISSDKTDKYIPVTEARRLLKITHRTMFDLIATGEIEFVLRNQGTTLKYLLRLSDIENLKCKFEQSLTSRALAKELGVDCEVVRELGRAGILRTRWRPAVDGYHTIKFDRDVAQELLNKLSRPISKACEPDGHEILDFSKASKLCESLGATVSGLIKAIADGEIQPCAIIQSPGLGRFLFTKATLARYSARRRPEDTLTAKAASDG